SVEAKVVDEAGNEAVATTKGEIDTTPPSAPTVEIVEDTNDDGYINAEEMQGDVDVRITLPADAKAGDTLRITNPDGSVSEVAITQEMLENGYDVSYAPKEGEKFTVSAQVVDAAGNEGEAGSDSAVVDTTGPKISVDIHDLKWSDNLVVNGDAESGIDGWIVDEGELLTTAYADNDWADEKVENTTDGHYFYGRGSAVVAHQDIDISRFDGEPFKLSLDIGAYRPQDDTAEFRLVFLDADGNEIETHTTGVIHTDSEMIYKEIDGTVPEGAVTAHLEMDIVRHEGNDADGYFDNIEFKVASAGDDIIDATDMKEAEISGQIEPGEELVGLVVEDEAGHRVEIDPASVQVADDGSFKVTGVDVSSLDDGTLTVIATVQDSLGNRSVATDTVVKDVSGTVVPENPTLDVQGLGETEHVVIDHTNVTGSGKGYSVAALNADGSEGSVSIREDFPSGFGVAGKASGADSEIGYDDALGASETLVLRFDEPVYGIDVSLSWNAPWQDAQLAFYRDGRQIETIDMGGGTDQEDPSIHFAPSTGEAFDEVRFFVPGSGDDFLIHSVEFDRTEWRTDQTVVVEEGMPAEIDIAASLPNREDSQELVVTVDGLKEGDRLFDDAGHSFTASGEASGTDISDWQLDSLKYESETGTTLTFTAITRETREDGSVVESEGETKSLEIEVHSSDDTFLFNPGGLVDGLGGEDTLLLHVNENIDFSNLPEGTEIKNIETIDLGRFDNHELTNLTLEDVIEMTDERNELVIEGDDRDRVEIPDAPENYTVEKSTEGGYDVYTYSGGDGDPTVTLKIDQDIQHG
ncbi:hypothetical protein, partial [Hydrogenimonas sp.]